MAIQGEPCIRFDTIRGFEAGVDSVVVDGGTARAENGKIVAVIVAAAEGPTVVEEVSADLVRVNGLVAGTDDLKSACP